MTFDIGWGETSAIFVILAFLSFLGSFIVKPNSKTEQASCVLLVICLFISLISLVGWAATSVRDENMSRYQERMATFSPEWRPLAEGLFKNNGAGWLVPRYNKRTADLCIRRFLESNQELPPLSLDAFQIFSSRIHRESESLSLLEEYVGRRENNGR